MGRNKSGEYYRPYINKKDGNKHDVEETHHLLPRSRFHPKKDANIDTNKKKLYKALHRAYHAVYGNATPVEAFKQLANINKKVLNKDFQQMLYELLNFEDEHRYYKDGIYLRKY